MNLTEINLAAVNNLLEQASPQIQRLRPQDKRAELERILEQENLSLQAVVSQLGNIVRDSCKESVKLAAIEVALKLHEVLPLPEASASNTIQINISGDKTQLLNVVSPLRGEGSALNQKAF